MKFQQRVELYKQYMAAEGASTHSAAPPMWEFLWSRGIPVPPPPFLGALTNAVVGAASLTAGGVVLWLLTFFNLRHGPVPWSFAVWVLAGCALLGLIGPPVYYHRMAKRHGPVRWSTFRGVRQRT